MVVAGRMATREFVRMARGEIIVNTDREIDSSLLNNGQAPISVQPLSLASSSAVERLSRR